MTERTKLWVIAAGFAVAAAIMVWCAVYPQPVHKVTCADADWAESLPPDACDR